MKETYNQMILQYMINSSSTNFNFREPYIKRSLIYVYPLFMLLHAIVCLAGIISNVAMVVVIIRRRLYQDQTFVLFINLAFADLIKCVFVMPMTLANLLIQNWLFGSFLCFFMPMLQYFPVHATMLTFLTIAIDRYRMIVQPFKSRVQASLCIIAIWVGSVCLVLPFAIYIKYIDLKATLGEEFDGVGLCTVRVERRIEEYIRAMFVTLYAMPLATMALLYVRISAEMKSKESATSRPLSVHFSPISTSTEVDLDRSSMLHHHHNHAWSPVLEPPSPPTRQHRQESTQGSDNDLNLPRERRTQNYLITMNTLFAVCWCPSHILVLVNYFVHETDNNVGHYDVTYMLFTWFGFLSTCTTPVLFMSWVMSDAAKDRLRGYFRFSNRRRTS
ncbi:hypothetical protein EGW08_018209, partial [Elysia chlorotica]